MKAIISTSEHTVELADVTKPSPSPDEVLVAVKAVCSNPTDWKKLDKADAGLVMGCDFAGVVEQVGENVPAGLIKIGERVAGFLHGGAEKHLGGSFAEYLVADPRLLARIPDDYSFEDAAQLGISGWTASLVLFSKHPKPNPTEPSEEGPWILVWGAATALGFYVVQLAKLSGYQVIATASPSNYDKLSSYGATTVLDYRDPDVAKKIRNLTENNLHFAVDCISEKGSPKLVAESISSEGGFVSAILPFKRDENNVPDNVETKTYLVYQLLGKSYSKPAKFEADQELYQQGIQWTELLTSLLKTKKVRPIPKEVLPGGLAGIAEGLQITKEGKVKAKKLTYVVADTPSVGATVS